MKLLIIVSLAFCCLYTNAQTPFTPYVKPKLIKKAEFRRTDSLRTDSPRTEDSLLFRKNLEKIDSVSLVDYFDHMSANIVFIQDAKKLFPTVNGEVMNYRFGIWTERKVLKEGKGDTRREKRMAPDAETEPRVHYLPFSIITKVSSDYLDSSAGPTNDATSFFGAPLTFRFSPACDLFPDNQENKLFLGMNTDLRLLVFGNDAEDKIDFGWGAYVSGGFTYMGKAHAFETNQETGEETRYNGKWSFSTILYWFKSGGKFNQALFNSYETKSLTGIEMMLRFRTSKKEDSRFNLLVSASNGFTREAPNFAKWEFRIGIGK